MARERLLCVFWRPAHVQHLDHVVVLAVDVADDRHWVVQLQHVRLLLCRGERGRLTQHFESIVQYPMAVLLADSSFLVQVVLQNLPVGQPLD